jgi:cation transport regulator ChaC
MRNYFAYAINMDVEGMRRRCPQAQPVGRARLPGHAFVITRDGLGSLVRRPGSEVHGVVWRIGRRDEQVLDDFEGVAHRQYRKGHLRVRLWEGGWLGCMAYLATNAEPGHPFPGYLDAVIRAAEDQRLPAAYVKELRRWKIDSGGQAARYADNRWIYGI